MNIETRILSNGRKYRLTHTGEPYRQSEYSSGGIKVCAWEPRLNKGKGGWIYIDNFRDMTTVETFFLSILRSRNSTNFP